jgi:diguanylate cyclase (GGDEF)-like protein
VGFVSSSIIIYQYNIDAFRKDTEQIANLTSESIYYQGKSYFAEYISVSKAMANNSMLKRFLEEETENLDVNFLKQIQNHLNAYKKQYNYASAYLVSTDTDRYYHFSGRYRTLTRGDPDNAWYYTLLGSKEEYSFDSGKDKYEGEMYFVDCKIRDNSGKVMGVIGVGFKIDHLHELMPNYHEEYDLGVLLISGKSIDESYDKEYAESFRNFKYLNVSMIKSIIEETGEGSKSFWGSGQQRNGFVVARYIPDLKYYLIIENDMAKLWESFYRQLIIGISVTSLIALAILVIFNKVILSYNERLLKVVVSQEMEYHNLLHGTIKKLYMAIYEFDITNNRAFGEGTRRDLELLGINNSFNYQEAIKSIAEKYVKKEFRKDFLTATSQKSLLNAYDKGIREISHVCMMNTHWEDYHWVRIQVQLFYYSSDKSVHMIVFSQDINDEKKRESRLLNMAETDPLTGLYNKSATREHICSALEQTEKGDVCAFVITDIDYFKSVNDTFGHATGDRVIKDFADRLKKQFRNMDICGRVGGDEFIVLIRDISGNDWLVDKIKKLSDSLRWEISGTEHESNTTRTISASIGVARYPQDGKDFDTLYKNADAALYKAKGNGRNGFIIHDS